MDVRAQPKVFDGAGWLCLAFVAVWLGGCGTAGFRDEGDWSSVGPERRAVLSSAVAMLGTPYRYGGSSPSEGFDCSGLVYYTHAKADRRVPRTSGELYQRAKRKEPDELTPGDLLFFRTRSTPSHVGIYLGKGQFLHAPYTGEAVRTESLNQGYWRDRFIGAGHFYSRDS